MAITKICWIDSLGKHKIQWPTKNCWQDKNKVFDDSLKIIIVFFGSFTGMVQIRNWKALSFEQITDNLDDTVETLLKDISNNVTLKILTKQ